MFRKKMPKTVPSERKIAHTLIVITLVGLVVQTAAGVLWGAVEAIADAAD